MSDGVRPTANIKPNPLRAFIVSPKNIATKTYGSAFSAHPLLYRAQRAKPSGLGFLPPVIRRAPVARRTAWLLAIGARNKGLPALLGNRLYKRRTISMQPTPDRKVRSAIDGCVENIGSIEVGIPAYDGVFKMALEQRRRLIEPLRNPKPPHKLLRQYQPSIVRHLAPRIALQME
jgi:hypothetical protein